MRLLGTQQLHCPAGHMREVRPGEASVVSGNQIKHLALTLTQHVHNWANMLLRNLYDSLFIWLALVPVNLLCDNLHSGTKPAQGALYNIANNITAQLNKQHHGDASSTCAIHYARAPYLYVQSTIGLLLDTEGPCMTHTLVCSSSQKP